MIVAPPSWTVTFPFTEIEGDFVVFLIGLRINKPWMLHKWLPVFRAMPRMIQSTQLC